MKNFWIVLLLIVGTLSFTACNAEEEPATEEPATEEVENEVVEPQDEVKENEVEEPQEKAMMKGCCGACGLCSGA